MHTLLGVALACLASALFNAAIVIQAVEARSVPHELGLSPRLLTRLVRRPRWLLAFVLQALAFVLQTVAYFFAPITVVQPADAFGLLLLVYLGSRKLGERVGRHEIVAVVAIVAGIVGLTLAAPRREVTQVDASDVLLPLGGVTLVAALPYLLRSWRGAGSRLVVFGAGFAFALSAFATKLLADAIDRRAWGAVLLVLAVAALGAALGTLSEQSALQVRQATQVAPIIFVIELLVPVALAVTVVGESWSRSGGWIAVSLGLVTLGTVALTRAPTIAQLMASGQVEEEAAAPT